MEMWYDYPGFRRCPTVLENSGKLLDLIFKKSNSRYEKFLKTGRGPKNS